MTAQAMQAKQGDSGQLVCWCCGQHQSTEDVVHLGDHPEVAVCLGCAHFLHQRARARDGLRAVRNLVMARRWHEKPLIGPVLRWLGTRMP